MAIRRESSAETAARFIASQQRSEHLKNRSLTSKRSTRCRVVVDFAEPTLRLVHDVLIDALHAGVDFGDDRHALLMIAEKTVAAALGAPACDDPPRTDLEVK
jgi:hypothetical protein